MDELLVRVGLVLGAIAVAAGVVTFLQWRQRRVPRWIDAPGLDPGVYLFTSATCPDCDPAREKLVDGMGEGGFIEFRWEEDRGVFDRLRVREVPTTLVVDESGRGRLWPGQPDGVLKRLGP